MIVPIFPCWALTDHANCIHMLDKFTTMRLHELISWEEFIRKLQQQIVKLLSNFRQCSLSTIRPAATCWPSIFYCFIVETLGNRLPLSCSFTIEVSYMISNRAWNTIAKTSNLLIKTSHYYRSLADPLWSAFGAAAMVHFL